MNPPKNAGISGLSLAAMFGLALVTSLLAAPPPDPIHWKWLDPNVLAAQTSSSNHPSSQPSARRLTNYEYNRSIRDLFGFNFNIEGYLQKDNTTDGFTNNTTVAFPTTDRVYQYMAASRFVSETALALNDVLVFKRRRWGAEDIFAENPNQSFMNRVGRYFADLQGHVRRRQRAPDPPRLHLATVHDSNGHNVKTLDLPDSARIVLRHDFPLNARYTIEVLASSKQAHTGAAVKITIDGQPVPLRIDTSPRDGGLRSYSVADFIAKGKRSIEFSVSGREHVLLASVEVAGPVVSDQSVVDQTQYFAARLPCLEPATSSARDCADRTIRYLASRAFRKSSVEEPDVQALLMPFQRAIDGGKDFRFALGLSIQAVLMSPRFLYRVEPATSDEAAADRHIGDFEFATRLSYFIWGSLPDEELRQLAAQGRLVNSLPTIRGQVTRMLLDPRADALVEAFGGGWLGYTTIRSHVSDTNVFPGFDGELRQAMLRETELYLSAFFRENWAIRDLIDSKTLFVNERLARHYGIDGVEGPQFQRLESDRGQRRGLLNHGSILTITSNSNRTSIVQRGLWIMRNALCESVGEPPPNVAQLSQEPDVQGMTLRQQMEAHRSNPACAACHRRIDPLGFSLENYDGVGRWRDSDANAPIDASGTLVVGSRAQSFEHFAEFQRLLRDDARFPLCVTQKLMTYALGRNLSETDEATAKDVMARTESDGHRIHSVIGEIVLSPPFRNSSR